MGEMKWMEKTKENKTDIPDKIIKEAEKRSGVSLSDIRVYYDSPEPDKYGALAYTQGNVIHIASGEERHIGHEVWHVVQQKQNRLKEEDSVNYGGVKANFNLELEREAEEFDRLWEKSALQGESVQYLLDGSRKVTNPNSNGKTHKYLNPVMNNLAPPQNYFRSTLLWANINGMDLREAWSGNGEHAEERLVAFLTDIEGKISRREEPSNDDEKQIYNHLLNAQQRNLSIFISSSPCSSVAGTRRDGKEGCLEKLNVLVTTYGYSISIQAHSWYRGKDNSQMYPADVPISVGKTAQIPMANRFNQEFNQDFRNSNEDIRQF